MKTLFTAENRLVHLKATPDRGADAAKATPILRESGDPTHKAEKAMDKIGRLTKTMDDLYKQKGTSKKMKNRIKKIHEKLGEINDKLNSALSLNDKQQEKIISSTLNALNSAMSSRGGELNSIRKIGIDKYAKKLKNNMTVKGNQNYQEAYEHMTGMFSLMKEGESINILGSTLTKKGTDIQLKYGKHKQTYSFYIVNGQWQIVNQKSKKAERRYTPQLAAELKNLPAFIKPLPKETPAEKASRKKTGKLVEKAAAGVPEAPDAIKKHVAGLKDGVNQSIHLMRFINPPNSFMRAFINAVNPKKPTEGIKKITILKRKLKEYGKKLDDPRNYSTAKKFEDNVIKGLTAIIVKGIPTEDLAYTLSQKFPQTESGPLLASYNKAKKGPAKRTDVASSGGRAEKAPTAGKYKSLVRKGASRYVANLDAGNGFKLNGVKPIQIQEVFDTPPNKRIAITIKRKNGDTETAVYHPNYGNYMSNKTGKRIRIKDGDAVTIDSITTAKRLAGETTAKKPKSDTERKQLREKLTETATKELKLNLTEMAVGEKHYLHLNQGKSLSFIKTSKDECTVQVGEDIKKTTFKISNMTDIRNLAEHIVKFEGKLPKVAKRKKAPRRRKRATRRPRVSARKRTPEKKNKKETSIWQKDSQEFHKLEQRLATNTTSDIRKIIKSGTTSLSALRHRKNNGETDKTSMNLYSTINGKTTRIGSVSIVGDSIHIYRNPWTKKQTHRRLLVGNRNKLPAVLRSMFPQKVPTSYVKTSKLKKKDIAG